MQLVPEAIAGRTARRSGWNSAPSAPRAMMPSIACPSCHSQLAAGDQFCSSCGALASGPGALDVLQDTEADAKLLDALRHETIGEYEILGELGRGGMAVVYLGHDISLDRKVAIKVLFPSMLMTPGSAERFKREARTAAGLSHINIIPIFAVKEGGRLLFFIMKFVEGRTLRSLVRDLGPLPIRMVQAILAQVGGALAHAHRANVIHRDIKPANVMIDTEGMVVVTDFGIAKVTSAEGITMTGSAMGTPAYMSPEQCRATPVTAASDQYSLGITAYELLTGNPPFSGPVPTVMMQHCADPPPPLLARRPDCPRDLAESVMRMLEKEPEQRFPTMETAMGAAGARPLSHDDPLRHQLIALARQAELDAATLRMSTPKSPSPMAPAVGPTQYVDTALPHEADQTTTPVTSPPAVPLAAPATAAPAPVVDATPSAVAATPAHPVVPSGTRSKKWLGLITSGIIMAGAVGGVVWWQLVRTEASGPSSSPVESGSSEADSPTEPTAPDTTARSSNDSDPPPPVADPAPSSVTGTITVANLPSGASATVDGTPQSGDTFELEPGRHEIRIAAAGFETEVHSVTLEAGEAVVLQFRRTPVAALPPVESEPEEPAAPARGMLILQLRPWANVSIDGVDFPEVSRLEIDTLTVGSHRLRLFRDGFVPVDTTVTIGESQPVTMQIRMTRRNR